MANGKAKFAYEVMVRSAPSEPGGLGEWRALGHGAEVLDTNLFGFLNALGAEGWEIVAVGDIGFGGANEILLKKTVYGDGEAVPDKAVV